MFWNTTAKWTHRAGITKHNAFLYDSRDRPKMMPRGQNSEVQNIHDRKSLPFVAANKHGLSAFLN